MTLFDLLTIVAVLVSVVGGLGAGAIRELVGLFAFALAVGGAMLLLPLTRPVAQSTVQPVWAASFAALAVSFLVIYFGLRFGGRMLTAGFRANGVTAGLDRLGGGAVGLARALVLLGGFWLAYRAATPVDLRPSWIEKAALLPLARASGGVLDTLAPQGVRDALALGSLLRESLGGSGDNEALINDIGDADERSIADRQGAAPMPDRPPTRHNPGSRRGDVSPGRSR